MRTIFLVIALIMSVACSAHVAKEPPSNNLEVYNNVMSEISLRSWDSKGLGRVIEKELLTIIKTKNGNGEIVVLHWKEDKSQFHTEVYRADPETEDNSSWLLINSNEEKTLTYQHGDLYMIHQLIEGKDGGQKSQIFRLHSNL